MKLIHYILLLMFVLLSASIATADQNIIRADVKDCLDYAIEYQSSNPEWGIVLVSHNTRFQGMGHFVNYYIDVNKDIHFHDEMYQIDYSARGWQYEDYCDGCEYYYFYIDGETPRKRFAGFKFSNSQEVFNEL